MDLPEVAKAVALDLWICDHYKVLPTEDRYKQLSEQQKYLLFLGFVGQPTDEEMHASYRNSQTIGIGDREKKNLQGLGYTSAQILKMRKELEKAQANG